MYSITSEGATHSITGAGSSCVTASAGATYSIAGTDAAHSVFVDSKYHTLLRNVVHDCRCRSNIVVRSHGIR